ncbi:gap junction delta-3 protein-like [Myripristis murdjan]|uniref:gap junction delta-3 protein-like n=1 Tax=Myripristis murdjan TaxID=586833 RepID=UPI0011763A03|nr:gap junction delta-3 protein [Myripristis murdjan]XP_029934550.1 gap junction delta-3 protein [Myripristis murdjan]XP_029934552.1 gap junction delta-3 protein [Myripristis murdjan]XP_029934553.1 gap junction delta-3 protein [Myripristis murdjan]XP_029934554.1 gap junction delta-3 protein [Myripristis murdjan]
MGEWGFLSGLFDNLQAHSPMLGRFWLFLMLVFRILILGTVASDLFEDEQQEFVCNTLQPGCKQGCYDMAFPISQYRFWVFHIVLISTPSLLFLMYAMHHHSKRRGSRMSTQDYKEELHMRKLYIINVAFRMVVEIGVLVGQWWLYGFKVEPQFPCSRFPCPYTVDCFTSRPAEKTIFLCFYFIVGVVSAISSFAELCYASIKWFCPTKEPLPPERSCVCQNLQNWKLQEAEEDEKPRGRTMSESLRGSVRLKGGSVRGSSSRKVCSYGHKPRSGKNLSSKTLMV